MRRTAIGLLAGAVILGTIGCGSNSSSDAPAPTGTAPGSTATGTRSATTALPPCPTTTTSPSTSSPPADGADTTIVDPAAPPESDPTESTESTVTTEPTEPTESAEPTESTESTETSGPPVTTAAPTTTAPCDPGPRPGTTEPPTVDGSDSTTPPGSAPRLQALTAYLTEHYGDRPWRRQLADYQLSTADDTFELTVSVRTTLAPDQAVEACAAIAAWSTSTFSDGTITVHEPGGAALASTASARDRPCEAA